MIAFDAVVFTPERERRRDRRLTLRFPILSRPVDDNDQTPIRGTTLDIACNGVRFETRSAHVRPGDLLDVTLSLPASDGVWPDGGSATCRAEVLRVSAGSKRRQSGGAARACEVAARFLGTPRLSF